MINYLKVKFYKLKAFDAYRAKKFESAIRAFENLWEFTPMEYKSLKTHILCHYSLKEFDSSIGLIDQGLEVFGTDEELLEIKASCFTLTNDFEKSFEITSQLIELDKENVSYLNMHAFNLDKIGRQEEAKEIYLKITAPTFSLDDSDSLYPQVVDTGFKTSNNKFALNNFGYIQMKSGEYKEAIENFDRAIEVDPHYPFPYNNRGFAYLKLGNLDKAIEDINHSIKLDPDNSFAYKNRALYYLELEDKEAALEDLKLAWALGFEEKYGNEVNNLIQQIEAKTKDENLDSDQSESEATIMNNLGFQKLNSEKYDEAVECFNRAILIDKDFAFAYNNRGFAYLKLGELEKSIQDIDHSINLDNENSYAYKNKALYFYSLNQHEKALVNLKIAKALGFEKKYGNEVNNLIQELETYLK